MSKWEMVRLGDIGRVLTGSTPKTSDVRNYDAKDIPFYKPGDFNSKGITVLDNAENHVSNYARDKIRLLPANSVLVTCIGIIGKVGITKHEATCNQQINAIITDCRKCDERFIAYAILRNHNQLNHIANAPVVPIVNKTQFSNVFIPLPPLPVQQKIADVLDKASALIEKRKAQIEKLDLLIKSQFIEMFGDPKINPQNWSNVLVSDVIEHIEAGWSANGDSRGRLDHEYAVLKVSAVTAGKFNENEYKVITEPIKKTTYPHKGDLLFSRANTRELVGATCIIYKDYPMLLLPDKLWRIQFNSKATCFYMKYVLSSKCIRNVMSSASTGTSGSMYNISMYKLRKTTIPLPPIDLQNQFVDFVQQVEEQKKLLQQSLEKLELNYKSLMQKCFRGEMF